MALTVYERRTGDAQTQSVVFVVVVVVVYLFVVLYFSEKEM